MKRFLALLLLTLSLAACNNASRNPVIKDYSIRQTGIVSLGLSGVTADVELDLDVVNPSRARYTVEALHADVFKAGETQLFAVIDLLDPASILPKSNGTVPLPLKVQFKRPLALLGGLVTDNLSQYEADVDLTIRKGSFKKHIQKQRMPLDRIANLLGKTE